MDYKILLLGAGLLSGTHSLAKTASVDAYKINRETVEEGVLPFQYGEKSTAAVSKISSKELSKSSARSIRNALFGKGVGLTATQGSGTLWEEMANFNIRGLQSLSNNGILILVDGIERDIDNLTIEEVDAVYVLKDAAAVALYGYKAANGVLSIVTKRGSEGKIKVGARYDHGFYVSKKMPDMADSYTYALAMNEAYRNDGKLQPRFNDYELDVIKNGTMPNLYPNVNWWDEVIGKSAHSNNYNVTFEGGSKNVRYYTMANLENNSGFLKNTDTNDGYSTQLEYSKANMRTNLDITLGSSTKAQVNLAGVLAEHNGPGRNIENIMQAVYTLPSLAFPVRNENGLWGGNLVWGDKNPVAGLQSCGYSRSHTRTLYADAKIIQDLGALVKGLSVSARVAYDNSVTFFENRTKTFEYGSSSLLFNNGMPDQTIEMKGGKLSELAFSKTFGQRYYNFNFFGNIDYARNFGQHELFTSLMYHFDHRVAKDRNHTFNELDYHWYGHYGFMNKYLVDVALGLTGSNRLPEGNKYNFSPVASLAWVASNEEFMKDVAWVDRLKFRASAGVIYSDYVPEWNLTSESLEFGGGYYFEDNNVFANGFHENRLPTKYFKAERAMKYNLGLDLSMFKSLDFTMDAYYQRRDQIMVTRSGEISSILGIAPSYVPAGIADSKGLEFSLEYNKQINDWTLNAGGNLSLTSNKVVEKLEEPKAEKYLESTGLSIGQPFALEAIGYFKDEADIANSPRQLFSDVRPGDIKYKDQNNDGFIDKNDMIAVGDHPSVPKTYYSFHVGVEYRGLGFDALFQGAGGIGHFMKTPSVYEPLANNNTISQFYYDNRWTPETPNAKFPRLTSETNENNSQNSTLWYADASYLKLRHCELYYKLPVKWISKARMSHAKIYLRGMDLLSINKMDVFDPEGIGVQYPQNWSLHLGLSVDF